MTAAPMPVIEGRLYRRRAGGLYRVLHANVTIAATLTPAVVILDTDLATSWALPVSEFTDGRFEPVDHPETEPQP